MTYSDIQVLVIDDDELIVEFVIAILEGMGVEKIMSANNVSSALDKFTDKNARTQLIICDWMMPGMSGLEFLEQVRKVDENIPFLMLTSKSTQDDVLEAMHLGVTRYVSKPFDIDRFQQQLKILLDEIRAGVN